MPYTRRSRAPARKPRYTPKSRFRKPASPLTMGKFKKEVKKMIYKTKERKQHGNSVAESVQVNTFDINPWVKGNMLSIVQGDGDSNRDGNLVRLSGLKVSGSLHSNGTNVGPIVYRMAYVQHIGRDEVNDPLFTKPDNTDTSLLTADCGCIHWRFNKDCYKVLSNKLFMMNTDSAKDNVARLFSTWVSPMIKNMRYDSSSTIPPNRNIMLVAYARRLDNDEISGTTIETTLNHTAYFVDV